MQVAIIGCGWAGSRHAAAFRQNGAHIRWAVDVERGRAEKMGASATATDYRRALDDPLVEAVSICLPHSLHAPVALAAAAAGKHILVEKPLAATLEEADQMIATAEQAGVVLMVAENVRFDPLYLKVRDLLQSGVIGQPALVQRTRECYLRRSFLEERRWFLDARAAAGGIMMSGGIHDAELLRMLIGEIKSVQSLRAPQRFLEMEGDDTSVALLRFHNGAVGVLVESFLMKSLATALGSEVHTLRIDGDLGSLSAQNNLIRLFSEKEPWCTDGGPMEHVIAVQPADTFALEIQHFLEAVANRTEPVTSGRSQRKPLEVVLAAYRSMETGLPVEIS